MKNPSKGNSKGKSKGTGKDMKEVANAAAKRKRRIRTKGQGQGQGPSGIVLGDLMGSMGSPDCAEGRVRVGDPADPVQQAGWFLGQRLQEQYLIAEGR